MRGPLPGAASILGTFQSAQVFGNLSPKLARFSLYLHLPHFNKVCFSQLVLPHSAPPPPGQEDSGGL